MGRPERLDPREIVDLTSPDAKNSPTLTNFSNIEHVQLDGSIQAGAQSEVVDLTKDGEISAEDDNLRRRKGVKRRLHTVCEFSSSSREKMQKHFSIGIT